MSPSPTVPVTIPHFSVPNKPGSSLGAPAITRASSGAAPASMRRRRVRPSEMVLVRPTSVKATLNRKAIGTISPAPNMFSPPCRNPEGSGRGGTTCTQNLSRFVTRRYCREAATLRDLARASVQGEDQRAGDTPVRRPDGEHRLAQPADPVGPVGVAQEGIVGEH